MVTNNSWNSEYNNLDGQLLIGSTSQNQPVVGTLTGGAGIVVTNGDGTITIDATKAEFWEEITNTTHQMVIDKYYATDNAALVTLTLPVTAAFGTELRVIDKRASGGRWLIAQNASQIIRFGKKNTTAGITGSLASAEDHDGVHLVCTVANTEWVVIGAVGNLVIN